MPEVRIDIGLHKLSIAPYGNFSPLFFYSTIARIVAYESAGDKREKGRKNLSYRKGVYQNLITYLNIRTPKGWEMTIFKEKSAGRSWGKELSTTQKRVHIHVRFGIFF